MTKTTQDQDIEFVEVKPKYIKFNVKDDYIKGTLIDIFTPTDPDQWGNINKVATLKALDGSFHGNDENKVVDKNPTAINQGEIWKVTMREKVADKAASAKKGQKIIFRLVELKPTKKGNPAKIISVLIGPMDEEYLKGDDGFGGF